MVLVMLSGGVLIIPVIAFVTSFLFWPGALLKLYNWYWRQKLGLAVRYSYTGSYRFCYFARGKPGGATPTILMLHGFSATKDMWLPVVRFLPKDQHVICVDMPGHEGTSRTGVKDYSIQGQVERIHQFVCSVGLDQKPFHLVGTSMGGNVAGVYTAHYPEHLCSTTLMCPAGLVYPEDSPFITTLRELERSGKEDGIPLIPSTPQELQDMLRLCVHKPLNFPKQILRGLLDNRIPNNGFYKEVFKEIVAEESRHSLQEHLHMIKVPVHVIWGKEDQVVHWSGTAVLKEAIPDCHVDMLEECGHSVALERPRRCANLIMDYLTARSAKDNKKLS